MYVIYEFFQINSERLTIGRKRQSSGIRSSVIPYDEHRFRSYIHDKSFFELESCNLVQEKTIELEDLVEYLNMVQEINTHG